ncbi:unnamed protein product [Urochloa decumbens]|uniref:Uncharacterized protein n=1 Tax=Urochloa decumbens TaxID=240449 RepID=A0ABC9AUL9_9POAL
MEVITGVLPNVLTKLGELLVGEYNLQKCVKGEIRFLQAELESMQGALEEISYTTADVLDNQDKIWATNVRELSYDIEDSINTFLVREKDDAEQPGLLGFKKLIEVLSPIDNPTLVLQFVKDEGNSIGGHHTTQLLLGRDTRPTGEYLLDAALQVSHIATIRLILLMEVDAGEEDGGRGSSVLVSNEAGALVVGDVCMEGTSAVVTVDNPGDKQEVPPVLMSGEVEALVVGPMDESGDGETDELMTVWVDSQEDEDLDDLTLDMLHLLIPAFGCVMNNALASEFVVENNKSTSSRDIKRRVIEADERRKRYKIDVIKPAAVDPRLLAHYKKATELVGIDEARDEVISILMEGDGMSNQHGTVVSIVGFGGLGKTTLANVVYEKLKEKFDCWAFVTVSQNPDMRKFFKGLLYELGKNVNDDTLDERQLINQTRKFLQTKRYCIFIDDIWSASIWDMIRCALPDDGGGYIIITTTRILKVAEQVGGAYMMKPLCLETSRKLLYRRIFGNEEKYECLDEHLTEVSDRILTKCAGVPLAIITIASLLANRGRNKMDWYEVCNSIGTGQYGLDVENMRKILAYSYYDLPPRLRTCLLYVSVFPEDCAIEKFRLIWMWIAEGFVQHDELGKGLYELGEYYFNELINKSLIQPVYDRYEAIIESCCVHDMVLDLVHSISSEENFVTMLINEHNVSHQAKKVRRLLLQSNTDQAIPCARNDNLGKSLVMSLCKLQKVQSLTIWATGGECNFDAWVAPRHLRRLQLQCCWFSRLPDWMNSPLRDLSFLRISVRELYQDDLEILGRLPALRHLYLMVDHENLQIPRRFIIGTSSFPCLVGCRLMGFLGAMVFQQGAMIRLESLAFTFHAQEVREITSSDGRFNLGLENLLSLQHVLVYFRSRGASEMEVEEAKAALSRAFEIHPNHPEHDIWG